MITLHCKGCCSKRHSRVFQCKWHSHSVVCFSLSPFFHDAQFPLPYYNCIHIYWSLYTSGLFLLNLLETGEVSLNTEGLSALCKCCKEMLGKRIQESSVVWKRSTCLKWRGRDISQEVNKTLWPVGNQSAPSTTYQKSKYVLNICLKYRLNSTWSQHYTGRVPSELLPYEWGGMEQMAKIETWIDNEDNKKTGINRMAEEKFSWEWVYSVLPPKNSSSSEFCYFALHFMSLLLSAPWVILSLLQYSYPVLVFCKPILPLRQKPLPPFPVLF